MDGYVEKGDGDVSSGYGFKNSNNLFQSEYSGNFKDIDGDVENGDVSSGYGSMNSYTYLQHNLLGEVN